MMRMTRSLPRCERLIRLSRIPSARPRDGFPNWWNWTTYADTARYVAEIAVDKRSVPRAFKIAGDVLNFDGIVHAYEVASGKKLRVERLSSLEDLSERIDGLQKASPLTSSLTCHSCIIGLSSTAKVSSMS